MHLVHLTVPSHFAVPYLIVTTNFRVEASASVVLNYFGAEPQDRGQLQLQYAEMVYRVVRTNTLIVKCTCGEGCCDREVATVHTLVVMKFHSRRLHLRLLKSS